MKTGAEFSKRKKHRYSLHRIWKPKKRRVLFIGLNPSTANETEDDPTIRRCLGFAEQWGCGGMYMANLFSFRATDPSKMKQAKNPIGKQNNRHILELCGKAHIIICAWGANGGFLNRDVSVYTLIKSYVVSQISCLGLTKQGFPKHPLYLKKDTTPMEYNLFRRMEEE